MTFIQGTIHAEQAKALVPGSFDAVHCSLVLMFVEQDADKLAVLEFFHRLLRPTGAVVLTDIVNATSPHTDEETFARWTALMRHRGANDAFDAAADRQIHTLMHRRTVAQLTSLLTQAGFRTVEQPLQALHTAMLVATK